MHYQSIPVRGGSDSLLTGSRLPPYTGSFARKSIRLLFVCYSIVVRPTSHFAEPDRVMSQVMKEKTATSQLPVAPPSEELSGVEKFIDSLRPYGSTIALGIALMFLVFIAIAWFVKSGLDRKEDQWRLLNTKIAEYSLNQNTSGLKEVAEEFPDGNAGMWGLQLAGDIDMRSGIFQLGEDRDAGLKRIEKARDAFKKVVDAPAANKTTMLQRRSTFALAYAEETLGNFDAAKALYESIIESAPESSIAELARRGIERTTNPAFVAIYDEFKNWEDPLAEAPGPVVPDRPDISFPKVDLNQPASDGEEDKQSEEKK